MKAPIITISFLLSALLCQQSTDPETIQDAYHAYLTRDSKSMKEKWKKIVAITKDNTTENRTEDLQYSLAIVQYGLLASTMRDQDEDLFDTYADDAEDNLELLLDQNKSRGEAAALLAAILGLKMGYSPIKGILLGPKSQNLMAQAMKDAPMAPLVWKLYGNAKLFTPETFGGDIKEAIKAYEKAITLYEANPEKTKHNWLYLDTMAFLGQAYLKDGQPTRAIAIYEKALKAEPDFLWVKLNLLPQAYNKKNTTN